MRPVRRTGNAENLRLVFHPTMVHGKVMVGDGQSVQVGPVRLDYLAPLAPFRGTRSDPNNSSLIIRATVAITSSMKL